MKAGQTDRRIVDYSKYFKLRKAIAEREWLNQTGLLAGIIFSDSASFFGVKTWPFQKADRQFSLKEVFLSGRDFSIRKT